LRTPVPDRKFIAMAEEARCEPTDELAAEIAARYRLDTVASWEHLGGSWTTNIRLQTGRGSVVARIHQSSTPAVRLDAIQAARRAVAAGGIPTPVPVADPHGRSMITLDNGLLAELEPYVRWRERMNTPDLLRKGFEVLGRLHDVLRAAGLPDAARSVRYANHLHADEAAERTKHGADRIRTWQDPELSRYADQVVRHIDAVANDEADLAGSQLRQLVHGDFWDNNVLFADGDLMAVIDFDFMADRSRIDDLALPIYFYLLEPGRGLPDDHDRQLIRELVDQYDAGTSLPLSREERLALPLAIARQPAWSVGRWVLELDEADARDHARAAADEFAVAASVLSELDRWQHVLSDAGRARARHPWR
jgi:homoserine kinase type II